MPRNLLFLSPQLPRSISLFRCRPELAPPSLTPSLKPLRRCSLRCRLRKRTPYPLHTSSLLKSRRSSRAAFDHHCRLPFPSPPVTALRIVDKNPRLRLAVSSSHSWCLRHRSSCRGAPTSVAARAFVAILLTWRRHVMPPRYHVAFLSDVAAQSCPRVRLHQLHCCAAS